MKKIIPLIIFTMLSGGCASVNVRSEIDNSKIQRGVYPAVREDVQWITGVGTKNYDPLLTGAEPIILTLAIIDIPLATLMDTLLLPADLVKGK